MSQASNALSERILENAVNQFIKLRKKYPNIASRNMAECYLAGWAMRLQQKALNIHRRQQQKEEQEFEDIKDLEKFYNLPKKSLRIVKEVKDE